MPEVAQAQSQMQQSGQNYGSYGPAYAGQLMGEGQQQAYQAALATNQQQFGDVIAGNQSYYNGPVAEAQTQANLASNLQEQTNLQNQSQANQYQLASADMANAFMENPNINPNSFNLENYGNQFEENQYNNALYSGGLNGYGAGFGNQGWFTPPPTTQKGP